MLRISRRNRLSWIFSAMIPIMMSWSRLPKQSEMPPSTNQIVPVQAMSTTLTIRDKTVSRNRLREINTL